MNHPSVHPASHSAPLLAHERLDVYQLALRFHADVLVTTDLNATA